jgi:hypothetical protein
MKLYHGGLTEVRKPRIMATDHIGDFGIGFYVTTDLEQARRFVAVKCDRSRKSQGAVSFFEVGDDFLKYPDLQIRIFREADEDWARFVESNRRDVDYRHDYDIVYGPVANDQVYASFALYESDLIDFRELLNRLKVRKLTDQVLFHTERSLSLLKYIGSEVVSCPRK